MRHLRLCISVISVATAGCVAGDVSDNILEITLSPDLDLNTEGMLLAEVSEILVELDSETGLYQPGEEFENDDLIVTNIDDDDPLELVIRLPVEGELPAIRLTQGSLPPGPLIVRAHGLNAAEETVASGGFNTVEFGIGEVRVPVPFNFRNAYLPPRIERVFPEPGEQVDRLGAITVILTKEVDPVTATPENFRVVRVADGVNLTTSVSLGGTNRVVTIIYDDVQSPGEFRVEISTAVTDTDGVGLDATVPEDGSQSFETTFEYVGTTTVPDWCHDGGIECPDSDGARLECQSLSCEPIACSDSACPGGTVCDPSQRLCVKDCRVHGDFGECPESAPCRDATGLCEPR